MLKSYIKIALRNILRSKVYTLINITGLAIGMACCILILLWVQNEFSYDRFHNNIDNLYRVAFTTDAKDYHGEFLPGLAAEFLKEEYPEILQSTNLGNINLKLTRALRSFSSSGLFVQTDFFDMFSFPLFAGNPDAVFTHPASIVITEELAQKFFGNEDPMGKTIKLEDGYDFVVTGVLQSIPQNSSIQFDFLLSFDVAPPGSKTWDNKCVQAYVLLQENYSYQEVSDKISNVYNDHNPGQYENFLYLQPMKNVHLFALTGGGRITYVYIFSFMALVILLIACINFINLFTARSQKRSREIGIKKVVGSSRGQLIYQFLTEAILLSYIALLFAVIVVELLLPPLNATLGSRLELTYSGSALLVFIGIATLTGIISGSYPAFLLSSLNPIAIMKGYVAGITFTWQGSKPAAVGQSRGHNLRRILVATQFSLSIFFIICAAVLYSQLNYIKQKNLGFKKEQVVMLLLKGKSVEQTPKLKTELLRTPAVEGVSVSRYEPTRWGSSTGIDWEGKETDKVFDVGWNWVDYDYLETLKLQMVQGRFFSREFSTDKAEAFIVNEAAIKAMEMDDPLGKRITRSPDSPYEMTGTVIGVIKDYHTESLHKEIRPFILLPSEYGSFMYLRIRSDNIPETLSIIENKVKELVPTDPFIYSFLDQEFDSLYNSERLLGQLVLYITFLAILISCLGLLGLAAYAAERRTKEIGIRKVMGAKVTDIVTLLSREFIVLVLVANLIAWPTAYFAMNRWLQTFAYRTDLGWWTFIMAGSLALMIALITVSYQAIRAATADPVKSLRYE